jgi:hypothetical protein
VHQHGNEGTERCKGTWENLDDDPTPFSFLGLPLSVVYNLERPTGLHCGGGHPWLLREEEREGRYHGRPFDQLH